MDSPLGVSIIIRSFNRLPSCVELINALVIQDYPLFEIVVVEQSLDRPPEPLAALEALAEANPDKLRVLSTTPKGPAGARNVGWRAAKQGRARNSSSKYTRRLQFSARILMDDDGRVQFIVESS